MHIGCSKLARPMVCAGYMYLDFEKDKSSSDLADEGTAASEYMEKILMNRTPGMMASNGVYFDEDMKFYTEPIIDHVRANAASEIISEQRIDWQTRAGVLIKGQYDICYVDKNGTLCIEDLKYGWGLVEVKENWQLLGYAIGEVIRRGQAFENISLKIHQPRPHHEDGPMREWLISYSELLEYKERIELKMEEIVNGNKTLTTSDKCKHCEGAREACPAFNKLFYRGLEVSHKFVQDSLTEEEVSKQLDEIKRAEEVLKIKKDSLEQLGTSRIKQGKIIPGYTMAEKYSNRKWNNGITPESIKMLTGIDPIETSFMSPSKAEKAGVSKELVKQLSKRRLTGVSLKKADTTKIGNNIFGNNNPQG